MEQEIKITIFENPKARGYGLPYKISDVEYESFHRPLNKEDFYYWVKKMGGGDGLDERLQKVGEKGTSILKKLFSLPGVQQVNVFPEELHIEIGKLFEWKDLEPKMIEILQGKDAVPPKIEPKILVECPGNKIFKTFYSTAELCGNCWTHLKFEGKPRDLNEKTLGKTGSPFFLNLKEMKQIATLMVFPYKLDVAIKNTKTWKELVPIIIDGLKTTFPDLKDAEVIYL